MRLLYYGFSSLFAFACCLPRVASKTLYPSDGTKYIDALVTTNRFCPVRCAKEIFQPESTEDLADWMRTKRQNFQHITVKGGGHSYSCQSVPIDGQALIHTERLNKVEVVTRKDGTAFARLGAGLTTIDVVPGLQEMGYSMPHGQCLTVGLAGWLFNIGNHPETNVYDNYYETPFLKKITGVDYDGNIVTIDKNGLSFVDSAPNTTEAMMTTRLQSTRKIANVLDSGVKAAGLSNYPSESIEMRIMQYWGASLMVATEFEIELLTRKEPPYLAFLYDISLFRDNNDMLRELYNLIKYSDPEVIDCGLHFSQNFMEGGIDAIGLQCVDFQDESGANARRMAPEGFSVVKTYQYGGFLAWNNDSYGTGWLPSFFAQPSKFFDDEKFGGLERWRQGILKLSSAENPCSSCAYQMSYISNLDVNMIDLLCSAPPEFQNECNSFALEINNAVINGLPKSYKQNLPFCEATTNRTDQLLEYTGGTSGLYGLALQAKTVWDKNNVVDFWLGVGHEGQDDQCEATEPVDVGPTCAAHSITIDDLVEAERRAIVKRCPDFFEYDSMIGINVGCDQYLQKQAKKDNKSAKKGKKAKQAKKAKAASHGS